jgi:spoIIIJ-associated protein
MDNQEKKEDNIEKVIRDTVKELLEKMGFIAEVGTSSSLNNEENSAITCNIKTEDSNFLIGQYGVNLQSLQHIARILVRKQTDDKINFIVDVNSYRQEKNSSIERLARGMAEEAVREKRAVIMRPMSSYERRIVHMELSKNHQVKTESVGDGESRKVVISPVELI